MNEVVSSIVFSFHSCPSISETTRIPLRTMFVRTAIASGMVARLNLSRLSTSRMAPFGTLPVSAAARKPASAPRATLSPVYADTPKSERARLSSS